MKNDELMNEIITIFYEHKERYGYRRIGLELRNRGHQVNDKKVKRLMDRMELKARQRQKRKYSSYKGAVGKIADNVIKREFKADKPNEKWYTDVTEFNLRGQKLYLSAVIDGFNQEVIAHTVSRSPNLNQTTNMLDKAIEKYRRLDGLILHSDQGWQYQHCSWQRKLIDNQIEQSMSRKGNSIDNALMENFFGLLKSEMFYGLEASINNLQHLEHEIDDYIHYFNYQRIKSNLNGLSPVNYRIKSIA